MILEQWLLTIPSKTGSSLFTTGLNNFGQIGDNTTVAKTSYTQITSFSWKNVSVGLDHTLAVRSDGALFGWGKNSDFQLGDNTTIDKSSPVQIGTSSWNSVFASDINSYAISADGALYGWGSNISGYVGNNGETIPEAWSSISVAFGAHYGITTDNRLFFIGGFNQGNAGLNDTISRSNPVQIGTSSWNFVDTNETTHTAAIRSDGALFTWGTNVFGQLGDNTGGFAASKSSPIQIGTSSWTSVSVGRSVTAAIRSDGALFTWGAGSNGGLGDNTTINKSSPVQIGTSSWTSVSVSATHALAIRSDGALFAWGNAAGGRLGSNNTVFLGEEFSWTAVSLGPRHSMAIRSDGALFTWGENNFGQLGNESVTLSLSPIQIGTSSWIAVATDKNASSSFNAGISFAIRADGALFGWGRNQNGEVGDNTSGFSISRSSPVQIGTSSWTAVSVASSAVLAIRADGALFTWGSSSNGMLAGGPSRSSPVQVGTSSWIAVSGGTSHVQAIRSDGALFGWGSTFYGAFGNGISFQFNVSSPIQIGSSSWTAVAAASEWSAAIRSDGALFTWGFNNAGQLGNNTGGFFAAISSPIQIGSSSWTSVSVSGSYALAIRSDGALFAWGNGIDGYLGDGTFASKSSPVQIGSDTNWSVIESGGRQNRAALANTGTGNFYNWGPSTGVVNQYTIYTPTSIAAVQFIASPIQIGTSSWTAVATDISNSYAIRSDGALFAWGTNESSQLGIPGSPALSSPVQVGSDSWSMVSAEFGNVAAVRNDNIIYVWGISRTSNGQIATRSSPTKFSDESYTFVGVTSSTINAIASANNYLYTMGYNYYGQTGVPKNINSNLTSLERVQPIHVKIPTQIGTSSWTSVYARANTIHAIRSDGALFGWGNPSIGIGIDSTTPLSSPVKIGTNSWKSVGVGNKFSMGLSTDGAIYYWGVANSNLLAGNNIEKSWKKISVNSFNVMAIDQNDSLYTWGNNSQYQLGLGDNISRGAAQNKVGTSSWTVVGCGGAYSFAIRSDGALFSWGLNQLGSLGQNLNTFSVIASPTQIGTSSWTSVSSGSLTVYAIRSDGALFAWGSGSAMGDNTIVSKSSPVQIGTSSWIAVSGGQSHALAIRSDGALFAWGNNFNQQLGDGSNPFTGAKSSPVQIGTSSWIAVSAGQRHSLAIRSDGALFGWGTWSDGVVGDNGSVSPFTNRSSPIQIGTSSWISVAAGMSNSFAVRSDNTLWGWGRAGSSLSAIPSVPDSTSLSSPVQIGTADNWVEVFTSAYGGSTSFARNSDGQLYYWGTITSGQAGNYEPLSQTSLNIPATLLPTLVAPPVEILANTNGWKELSVGRDHVLAINASNDLFSWGNYAATNITQLGTWSKLSTRGTSSIFAIRSDGALFVWGAGSNGLLGINLSGNIARSAPVQIGTSSWIMVDTGFSGQQAGAIRSDGALFAWGQNPNGELGDNTRISKSSPVQIGTSSWTAVSMGAVHTLAIRSDGALFAWGSNFNGELGDNTGGFGTSKSSPIQIGSSSWTVVSAGASFSMAIRSDGALFTWGNNNGGMLGDSLVAAFGRRSSPVQVGTSSWVSITSGFSTVLGITSDGSLWQWGGIIASITEGGFGPSVTFSRISSPVQVPSSDFTSWTLVSSTTTNLFLGTTTNGHLYVWGVPTALSNPTFSTSPILVSSDRSYVQISAKSTGFNSGTYHAIDENGTLFGWGDDGLVGLLGNGTNNPTRNPNIGPTAVNALYDLTPITSMPTQIGSSKWKSVEARENINSIIDENNVLYQWGFDPTGGRFLNNNTAVLSPTVVESSVVATSIGGKNSAYRKRLTPN